MRGVSNRRLSDVGQRELAEPTQRLAPAHQLSKLPGAATAVGPMALRRPIASVVPAAALGSGLVDGRASRERCGAHAVEHVMRAICEADMRYAATQHPHHHRLDDRKSEQGRDGSVDRVAARFRNINTFRRLGARQ